MFPIQLSGESFSLPLAGGARATQSVAPSAPRQPLSHGGIGAGLAVERIARTGPRGGCSADRTIQAAAARPGEHDAPASASAAFPQHSHSSVQPLPRIKNIAELTAAYRNVLRRAGDGPTRFRRGAQALAFIEHWKDNETLLAIIASERRLLLFRQVVSASGRAMRQTYVKDPRFDQVSEKLRATKKAAVLHGLLDSHIDAHDLHLTYEAGKTVGAIRARVQEVLRGRSTRHFDPAWVAALAERIERDDKVLRAQ
jgi:hypothetical protein